MITDDLGNIKAKKRSIRPNQGFMMKGARNGGTPPRLINRWS